MTSTRVVVPACFITLVSASCTTRYADSSTPPLTHTLEPSTLSVDGDPGVADVVDELGDVGEPRRRCVGTLAVAVAQHAEQAAHLGERAAGCGRDGVEGRRGLVGPVVEHVGADAGLHGDHRHRVGDDVVELLGDPQPLLGEDSGRALALDIGPLLGLAQPDLDRLATGPHRDPNRPGDTEERHVAEHAEGIEAGRVGESEEQHDRPYTTARPTTARRVRLNAATL